MASDSSIHVFENKVEYFLLPTVTDIWMASQKNCYRMFTAKKKLLRKDGQVTKLNTSYLLMSMLILVHTIKIFNLFIVC